jgi:hypothetical protein
MVRTFEGIMIKVLEMENVKIEYSRIFHEFETELKTAEPPYINLIYATHLIKKSNKLSRNSSIFMMIYMKLYLWYKKINFKFFPGSKSNWKLARNIFSELPTQPNEGPKK